MRFFALFFLIFLFNSAAYSSDFKLLFPVKCDLGKSCWILNYMDAAGNDVRAQDFMCGPRTYNTHTGIDIAVRDLITAQNGVDVIAPADGRVVYARSDSIDQIYVPGTQVSFCGNGLVILHDSGWETRYCHLKEKSLTVQRGDTIKAGDKIAEIGLSGATSWPHLAFSVLRNGKFYDPFTGRLGMEGCGLTPRPLWTDAGNYPYHAFSIFNLGFSEEAPDREKIDLGIAAKPRQLAAGVQALHFWAYAFGMQPGDIVKLTITGPDGQELASDRLTMETAETKSFFTVSHDRGNGLFEPGVYTGLITLERGAGKDKKINEWKRLVELVKVEN